MSKREASSSTVYVLPYVALKVAQVSAWDKEDKEAAIMARAMDKDEGYSAHWVH